MSSSVTTADFATRMAVLKQLSIRTGIRLPTTIIPEGESLIPYGEQRQRALKEEIYALPTVDEAARGLAAIRREQAPKDATVPLQGILMSPENGGLYGKSSNGAKALGYTEAAFSQASNFLKPDSVRGGFAQTILALPPKIRAEAFNHFAASAPADKSVVLRTILAPQRQNQELVLRRSIQAVVSERYSVMEDHYIAEDLNSALPDGARARFTQTEGRSDLEIFWPAMTRQLKVGDIALIALHAVNSQIGRHSIKLTPKILRVLCLNFTTAWGVGLEEEISFKHMGEVREKFRVAVKRALQAVEPFILAFGDAYQNPLPKLNRAEVIERTMKVFELPQRFGQEAIAVWDADGDKSAGDTLAGLANAMTRASQTMGFDRAEVVEEAAGRIIRQGWQSLGL